MDTLAELNRFTLYLDARTGSNDPIRGGGVSVPSETTTSRPDLSAGVPDGGEIPVKLPYRVETRTGDSLDIDFPLHPATDDPVRTAQVLSAVLEAIDRDIDIVGPAGNGDVLQAVAMALAVRATMIHAPVGTTAGLARDLLQTALTAAGEAPRRSSPAGHA